MVESDSRKGKADSRNGKADSRNGKAAPARRRRFRWLQLSLRTLLLAMVGVSLGMWWFLRPRPRETNLPGGYVLRAHVRSEPAPDGGPATLVRHGRAEVVDAAGRVRVRGQFDRGRQAGTWTYYDESGRRVLRGRCDEGRRVGEWTGWHANGRKAFEGQWGRGIRAGKRLILPYSEDTLSRPSLTRKGAPVVVAVREGTLRRWWANGQLRQVAEFALDQPHGPCSLWDADGRLLASGRYEEGVRQGPWKEWDAKRQRQVACHYLDGVRYPERGEFVRQLAAAVRGDDAGTRYEALRMAGRLGADGLPVLAAALDSPDRQLRRAALDAMVPRGEMVRPLAERLGRLEADTPREQLAILLARCSASPSGPEQHLEQFMTLAAGLPDQERAEWFERLHQLEQPAWNDLARCLESDDPGRRRLAFEALATGVRPRAWRPFLVAFPGQSNRAPLDALITEAVGHRDPQVAEAAGIVLQWLGPEQPQPPREKLSSP